MKKKSYKPIRLSKSNININPNDSLLNRIENEEIREAIRKVYCEKTPMRIVASEMNISKSGLGKAMDKELYKIQKRGRIHAKCVLKY